MEVLRFMIIAGYFITYSFTKPQRALYTEIRRQTFSPGTRFICYESNHSSAKFRCSTHCTQLSACTNFGFSNNMCVVCGKRGVDMFAENKWQWKENTTMLVDEFYIKVQYQWINSGYIVVTEPSTRQEASAICAEYGGDNTHLVYVETQQELDFLSPLLDEDYFKHATSFTAILTGGYRATPPGYWMWGTSGVAVNYEGWFSGQPNNGADNFVTVDFWTKFPGSAPPLLSDNPDDRNDKIGFMCEVEMF